MALKAVDPFYTKKAIGPKADQERGTLEKGQENRFGALLSGFLLLRCLDIRGQETRGSTAFGRSVLADFLGKEAPCAGHQS